MPGFIIGGVAMGAAGAVLGIGAAKEQAAVQAYQAQAAHANAMSQRNWQVLGQGVNNLLDNIAISRRNQARWRMNRQIQDAAISNRALKELQSSRKLGSAIALINQGYQDTKGNLFAAAAGSNISPNSGTFKLLMNQLTDSTEETLVGAKVEKFAQDQAIIREYEAELGKRDLFSFDRPAYFVPGMAPQAQAVPQSAGFFQQATAALSGFGAGMNMVGGLKSLAGGPTSAGGGKPGGGGGGGGGGGLGNTSFSLPAANQSAWSLA
tara:strand:+ start:2483 stop:3277 length:795 start_codon:yes stop_codon:yes gene_type:complete